MKSLLFTLLLFFCVQMSAQRRILVESLTTKGISGTAKKGRIIRIDINNDGDYSDVTIVVDSTGMYNHTFVPELKSKDVIRVKMTKMNWRHKAKNSRPLVFVIQESSDSLAIPTVESMVTNYLDEKNKALANTTLIYKTTISNTNFSIPIARFNLNKGSIDNAKGNIELFNSIGAGVGLSWGRMEITRDNQGQITNEEFSNTIGFHLGALFSSGTSGEEKKNVFAPTLNLALLDFQIGTGYELGTIQNDQRRFFFTLSYAIPLYKLVRKGYRIWRIAPYPISSRRGSNQN